MTLIVAAIAYALGAWSEHAYDLSARAWHLWRRWQAYRKGY